MRSAIPRHGVTLIAAAIATSLLLGCGLGQQAPTPTPVPEEPSPVTAKATIVAGRQARLSFQTLGRIAALPKVGDRVEVGQEIARLDTAELDLAVTQAEDAVSVSQALLAQAQAPARDVDIAALESAYQAAVARYNQVVAGATTADLDAAKSAVASAESGLVAARARLQQVQSGSKASEVAAAATALSAAKSALSTAKAKQDALDPAEPAARRRRPRRRARGRSGEERPLGRADRAGRGLWRWPCRAEVPLRCGQLARRGRRDRRHQRPERARSEAEAPDRGRDASRRRSGDRG